MSGDSSRVVALLFASFTVSIAAIGLFVSSRTHRVSSNNPSSASVGIVVAEESFDRINGLRYKPYADEAEPIERWMYAMLDQPVKLHYPWPNVSLKDVLIDIEYQISETYGVVDDHDFQLMFWPDYAELGLDPDPSDPLAEIRIASIDVSGMKLRNALKLIFGQVRSPLELTYVIQHEVMLVTSVQKANSEDMLFTRVYDVGDLLDVEGWNGLNDRADADLPETAIDTGRIDREYDGNSRTVYQCAFDGSAIDSAQANGMGVRPAEIPIAGPDCATANSAPDSQVDSGEQLMDVVMSMTAPPNYWMLNGDEFGYLDIFGKSLVVRQTHRGHVEVVRVLNQLSESRERQQ